jgi:hypothetical protein
MRSRMRRRFVPYVLAAHAAAASPLALAVAQATADDKPAQPAATASVVRVDQVRAPRRVVVHRKLRPWRHPSPRQVQRAIRSEARRWHIPAGALSTRVACESHYHWWASNGQFVGVLQFGPNAFYRGLHTIRDHRIRLVVTRRRTVHDARVFHYSDGRVARKRGRPHRQTVMYVYNGRLSRHPSITDTWTQLRIGAQAIRGISAVHSSEWSCAA